MSISSDWREGATWSLGGGILAGTLMYLATLWTGRLLGPQGFGEVAFGVVLAQLFAIACVRGFDFAAARAVVLGAGRGELKSFVGTAYGLVTVNALSAGLLLLVMSAPLSATLGWAKGSILGAAAFLMPVSLKAINERVLPALGMTRILAAIRPLEGTLLLLSLAGLITVAEISIGTVVAVMATCGSIVVVAVVIALKRKGFLGLPGREARQQMSGYAGLMLALTLAPLPLQFADRIVVQHRLTDADLGLYVACATATQLAAAQVVALLSGVLLPGVIQEGPPAIRRLQRLGAAALFPAAVVFACALVLSLWLLGSEFRPSRILVALFAGLAAVQFTNGLLHVIIIAEPRAVRRDLRLTLARSTIYVVALAGLLFGDNVTLEAVVATLLVAELAHTVILSWLTTWTARHWVTGKESHVS